MPWLRTKQMLFTVGATMMATSVAGNLPGIPADESFRASWLPLYLLTAPFIAICYVLPGVASGYIFGVDRLRNAAIVALLASLLYSCIQLGFDMVLNELSPQDYPDVGKTQWLRSVLSGLYASVSLFFEILAGAYLGSKFAPLTIR